MVKSKLLRLLFLLVASLLLGSCSRSTLETKSNYDWKELPDGSIVYLNQNSLVEYDNTFIPRTIHLEGEAFFSVASGDSPFNVITEHGEITVTGTEFNVRSTADELAIEVEEGSVELMAMEERVKLKKGGRAVYNATKREVRKAKAEFEFELWMRELEIEFKKLGKEVNRSAREVGKESKKLGKEFKKEVKKLKID